MDSRKHKANQEVYTAFIGHSRKHDPSHVKLQEAGRAMAKRVFHPLEAERWPTREANAFMAKNLTLIPEQKMELESDLVQETFFKDFEKNPLFKAAFDFKTKMFTSMKSQRTSLVPLFRLKDHIAQVKQHVDETLDICRAVVIPDGDPELRHTGWGEEDVLTIFKPSLHSAQVSLVQEEDELHLSDIEGLDPHIAELI